MLTTMTEQDWKIVLQVFQASRSRRGDQGQDDRGFLEYLHTPHRLRLVAAFKQLGPDRGPVLFQVRSQGI